MATNLSRRLVLAVLLSSLNPLELSSRVQAQKQAPFLSGWESEAGRGVHEFGREIQTVGVIGGGIGGLIAYRELTRAGFDVHIFERDHVPGGNWHYTDEAADHVVIPNADPVVGDFKPSLPPNGAPLPYEEDYHEKELDAAATERRRNHRGPKPIWKTLHSNAPAPRQQITEFPWPKAAPWELPHKLLQNYLRGFASYHGLNTNDDNPNVNYNTRVELVEKRYDENGKDLGWTLTLKRYVRVSPTLSKATWFKRNFDAIVVATGRYNAPNIPRIDGIERWYQKFPDRIIHSREYRVPEPFTNETLLIVGAKTSGGEISRDLISHVGKIYQSVRPDNASVPHFALNGFLYRLPRNVTLVPEIKRFHPPGDDFKSGKVELYNGTIITGIDRIIFATGFRYSFPFIPQYHNSSVAPNEDSSTLPTPPIVTDGTHLRSLYLDLFYIPDPTLAFINMNTGMQSFTYAEYLTVALAKVWKRKAELPSTQTLWRLHQNYVEEKGGYNPFYMFLGTKGTRDHIRYFIGWLNNAAVRHGGRQLDRLPQGNNEIDYLWATARFGPGFYEAQVATSKFGTSPITHSIVNTRDIDGDEDSGLDRFIDAVYSDNW